MLSYMVPTVEDKPPPGPKPLQLELSNKGATSPPNGGLDVNVNNTLNQQPTPLTNGHGTKRIIKTQSKTSNISAESSVSSLSSVMSEVPGTHTGISQDKAKHKTMVNGHGKHPNLKRVSFGSSKGSMVETLIYESPLQEEPEPSGDQASVDSGAGSDSSKASKVRVTFFECERPLIVSSPEPEIDGLDVPYSMTGIDGQPAYNRQASTDSGWDNPFRPDGDLSREADEIVEMIKGGKPITPTSGVAPGPVGGPTENGKGVNGQPKSGEANGTVALGNGAHAGDKSPVVDQVQRSTVAPTDASQVEHVNLKKKPKCKCCVIQ